MPASMHAWGACVATAVAAAVRSAAAEGMPPAALHACRAFEADAICHYNNSACAAMLPTGDSGALQMHVGNVVRILKVPLAGRSFTLLQVDWYRGVERDARFAQLYTIDHRVRAEARFSTRGAFIDASRIDHQVFFSQDTTPGNAHKDHVHIVRSSAYTIPPHLLAAPRAAVAALEGGGGGGGGRNM